MSRLIWTETGDYIDLVVLNYEVYEYFLANLNANKINRYPMIDFGYRLLSDELLEKYKLLQTFARTRLRSNTFDFNIDPSSQEDLNHLHRTWVKFHQQYPNVGVLFDKSVISRINKLIHYIEELPQDFIVNTINPGVCFKNIFGISILKHGIWNLSVEFNNLGRSSYNKWCNGDAVQDTDTNNFNDIYTELRIKVLPNEEHPLPVHYLSWCKQHGLESAGNCLPLANFDNLEKNLLKYKQLVLLNSIVENNFIILE